MKVSIFWELPYWHTNLIRHNLDVMHIKKNIFDNILSTIMNIKWKTKNNAKARLDLATYCKCLHLKLQKDGNGRVYKPKATYSLTREQKIDVYNWVKELKFSDGYASNIFRCVNIEEYKFYRLKNHNCHVFMEQLYLLPFMIYCQFLFWMH